MKNYDGNVQYNERIVNGKKVITMQRDFIDCCILEVEVGTNGFQGGDGGHGCRTYIRFTDNGSTCMDAKVKNNCLGTTEIELQLYGDAELQTIARAFKWAAKVLETQSDLLQRDLDDCNGDVL